VFGRNGRGETKTFQHESLGSDGGGIEAGEVEFAKQEKKNGNVPLPLPGFAAAAGE